MDKTMIGWQEDALLKAAKLKMEHGRLSAILLFRTKMDIQGSRFSDLFSGPSFKYEDEDSGEQVFGFALSGVDREAAENLAGAIFPVGDPSEWGDTGPLVSSLSRYVADELAAKAVMLVSESKAIRKADGVRVDQVMVILRVPDEVSVMTLPYVYGTDQEIVWDESIGWAGTVEEAQHPDLFGDACLLM